MTTTAKREYKLAGDPYITPVSGQVRREILEFADGLLYGILVVANDDAMDVLEALRRAYQDGREDNARLAPQNVSRLTADMLALGAIRLAFERPDRHAHFREVLEQQVIR